MKLKMNYVVWRTGETAGEPHKDVRAVVEPSGALCLYKTVDGQDEEYLHKAYPSGVWDDVRQQ